MSRRRSFWLSKSKAKDQAEKACCFRLWKICNWPKRSFVTICKRWRYWRFGIMETQATGTKNATFFFLFLSNNAHIYRIACFLFMLYDTIFQKREYLLRGRGALYLTVKLPYGYLFVSRRLCRQSKCSLRFHDSMCKQSLQN